MMQIEEKKEKKGTPISWDKEEDFMVVKLKRGNKTVLVHKTLGEKFIEQKKAVEVKGVKIVKPKLNFK